MNDLLAKSDPQTTLKEHIEDCLRILRHLKYAFPKVLSLTTNRFWDLLHLAIICHDLGKGHSEFQKVLCGNRNNDWKGQRHELFSLPFVSTLSLNSDEENLLKRIIAGHHKTFSDLRSKHIAPNYPKDSNEFEDEFKKVDTEKVFKILAEYREFDIDNLLVENPGKIFRKYRGEQEDGDIKNYFTTLLLFGALKHCDHLGSAYIKKLSHIKESSFSFLYKKRQELLTKDKDFYSHQKTSSNQTGNVILTAPTGSGKTETAFLWLKKQINENGQGRVFYVLPFTASINAMFRRLSSASEGLGENNVGMLHGKLTAFLYDYFQDESSRLNRKEEIARVREQFKTIGTPLKILTPFQLLKHIFGLKGFEKGIFEWTGGYFIFDEIHAYDASVFAQIVVLLKFLTEKMQASIFIMTATLPTFLKKHLQEAIGNFQEITANQELYESFDRHRVVLKNGLLSDNYDLIFNDLKEGKKVLIVCNTIEQAQLTFIELDKFFPLLIHGGFNGRDRNDKEKQLSLAEPQLLIGTQAIEVSLDIDYDIIYTEPAPLDALIQRFGRVNRKREKKICDCVVFRNRNEVDEYIYGQGSIDRTLGVFEEIIKEYAGLIKEKRLQKFIDKVYPDFDEKDKDEFQMTYNALTFSIENNLIPFEHSNDRETDFYKQFDGIKVVPVDCELEYKRLLEEFDFIGAELLKVQIRKNRFAQWIRDGALEKEVIFVGGQNTYEPLQIDFYVLKKKYSEHLGLQKNYDQKRFFKEDTLL